MQKSNISLKQLLLEYLRVMKSTSSVLLKRQIHSSCNNWGKILVCFSMCLFMVSIGKSQDIHYSEVVKEFAKSYGYNTNIRFEKRDGSYWVGHSLKPNEPFKSNLYYDNASGNFNKLPINRIEAGPEEAFFNHYLSERLLSAYQLQPFYGYEGWCYDVIEKFTNQYQLSDSATYALGRAYSACASDLLNNNSGLSLKERRFIIDKSTGLTSQQIQTYLSFSDSAITNFNRVYKKKADFLTVVGNIKLKLEQEYVASFVELWTYSSPQVAARRLPEGLFDSTTKLWAKNILDACEPGSIYMAYGDNDFFPLLYLQEKENYRKDIIVLSQPLLQSEDYLFGIHKNRPNNQVILDETSIKGISGLNKSVFFLSQGTELFDSIITDAFSQPGKGQINFLQTDFASLSANKLLMPFEYDTLRIQLNQSYIERNELALLVIIANNYKKTNIYLSGFSAPSLLKIFDGHLLFKGMVYQVSATFYPPPYTDGFGALDADFYSNWFQNEFIWDNELLQFERFPKKLSSFRKAAVQSALTYQGRNNKAMSTTLVEVALHYWPHDAIPFDWDLTDLITYYLEKKQPMDAKKVADQILETLKSRKPKTPESLRIEALKLDAFSKRIMELQLEFPTSGIESVLEF